MSLDFTVRPAEPGDAEALTRLAEAVSAEPEAWLISADGDWRSVGDERRYLKAVRGAGYRFEVPRLAEEPRKTAS